MGYGIFFAICLTISLLFLAFFIPSKHSNLDKNKRDSDTQKDWKLYIVAFILTTFFIATLHFVLNGKAYVSLSDIYFYIAPLLAVSPNARRIYRAIRKLQFRR